MSDYNAPVADILFTMKTVAGLDALTALPGYEDATAETVQAILEEAGKFAGEVLAPLNTVGDREGCKLENGVVRTPTGSKEAYRGFAEAGWNAVAFDPDYGGQGMPWVLTSALQEIWNAADMAFSLCPLLTQGAIEALQLHGTPEQKSTYLPKMISGQWTGTMNLTEPQAGSDLGAIRSRAEPTAEDGVYRLTGQKIFITYGEHDFTENIVHFVLARLPDAPAGSKGISLFIVPKFLPNADGTPGQRNDLRVVSLEHKLGIHASPTCVMAYGDNEGAIAYRIGEPHRGLEYMFTMMNNARLAVGIQGLAIAERAYQHAVAYARQRVQGAPVDGSKGAPILHHPDVRRNLLTMRALTEGMRALVLYCAGALDRAKRHPDPAERARNQALTDLLIPIVKAWCTDQGVRVASLGVQVHGGVGFIEQTGAAQYFRDSRIAPIYEGTNGIQAMDLLGRKLLRDRGQAMQSLIAEITGSLGAVDDKAALTAALRTLEQATAALLKAGQNDLPAALAVATPYLGLCGTVIAGWLLARSAVEARNQSGLAPDFVTAKQATAAFFSSNILVEAETEAARVTKGGASTLAFPLDAF
ncbi:acyl-CoA dehydrogenase [Dongia sedimenti]|uniref:Acyl-CoA dehydrogenase n=1 Tax=Dongia sedimenti TaxID=3064282 RepID=A0ABU0YHS0_9PROT|nr:acyl-CoA dehydrogenase [Rhodospirillaceae bacterium R-7]